MPYYIAQPDPGFHVQAKSIAKHSQAAVAQIHSISTDHSEPTRVEDKSSQGTPGDEAVIMMHTGGLGNSTVLGEAVLGRLPRRILQHRSHLKAHNIGDPTCRSANAQSPSYRTECRCLVTSQWQGKRCW